MKPYGKAVSRRNYRFQIQGPNAKRILDKLNGGPMSDVKFFNMDYINIKGRQVRCLRHGMAGAPGLELWGPYEEYEEIREYIAEQGKEFGLTRVGSRVYPSAAVESGWNPASLPAVYSGEEMRAYREWLPATRHDAVLSLIGSYATDNIEDYYVIPHDLGYGQFVKFDHDFIGSDALQAMVKSGRAGQRRKVTFEWNGEDLARILSSVAVGEQRYKLFDLPNSNYGNAPFDMVTKNGKLVGMSMYSGYSANERCALSVGWVDADIQDNEFLTLVWGEENGGTRKPQVERHVQTEVRVRVAPAPYAKAARESYAPGWRTR
jgi:vanillate/3-O-methylgallate O-demethylase